MTKWAGLLDFYFTVRMGLVRYAISAGQEAATRPRSGRVARCLLLSDGRRVHHELVAAYLAQLRARLSARQGAHAGPRPPPCRAMRASI